jgi:hypothetical protein
MEKIFSFPFQVITQCSLGQNAYYKYIAEN